jgi:hypothetical protein
LGNFSRLKFRPNHYAIFSKKNSPIAKKYCPNGETSPSLVTLAVTAAAVVYFTAFNLKWSGTEARVARFFLVQHSKTGKNIPNDHKMYQIVIRYVHQLVQCHATEKSEAIAHCMCKDLHIACARICTLHVQGFAHCMCKDLPVIPVNKVVDQKE